MERAKTPETGNRRRGRSTRTFPSTSSRHGGESSSPRRVPAANFVLALVVYWAIAVAGVTAYVPIVGTVEQGTPAHAAGLRGGEELVAIDGRPTPTWSEVSVALAGRLGETGEIHIAARRPDATVAREYRVPVEDWRRGEEAPDLLDELGIVALPAVIGRVRDDSAAERAGLAGLGPDSGGGRCCYRELVLIGSRRYGARRIGPSSCAWTAADAKSNSG